MEVKREKFKLDAVDGCERFLVLADNGMEPQFDIYIEQALGTHPLTQLDSAYIKTFTDRAEAEKQFDLLVEWLKK